VNFARNILRADFDPAWLLRIFTVIPVVLILVAGAGSIWIYFFVLSLLPQGQSVVETPGLSANVSVVRDRHGVPGIIGEKEEDLALVLGYVMAQDRLWQMDYFRRAGRGTLAEILGEEYLESDHLMRTVAAGKRDVYRASRLGERERSWVEHFVRGMNTYIANHSMKPPVEFSLLAYRPRPFSADDIMSIVLALAWHSSPAMRVDPVMTSIMGKLGKEKALHLIPTDPAAPVPFVSADLNGWIPRGALFQENLNASNLFRFPGFRGGCAWAVGRNKSASGKPIVASSMYQVLTAPGFWYKARMAAGNFHLSGSFIPGVPVALAGTNGKLSWGSISTTADDADLYIERLDPDDSDRYWRVDRSRKIRQINENYRVKGRSKVSRVIRLTDTGPLVSNVQENKALSLRWTAHDGLGLIEAFFALNRATEGQEARAALKALIAPCLNVIWADDRGGFGVQSAGRIPIRPPESDGIVPMPGWTGTHDWIGFIPFDELPSITNPVEGFTAVADGRPGGKDYPFLVSCYWSGDSRQSRIEKQIRENKENSRESFQRMQGDTYSPFAKSLTQVMLKAVSGETGWNPSEQEALRVLGSWDCNMNEDSAGAAVFGLVHQSLIEELFLDRMGERLYTGFTACLSPVNRAIRTALLQKGKPWLGDAETQRILKDSFRKAVSMGSRTMGDQPSKWQWGDIHTTEFRHPLTSRSRFLEALYHVGPVPFNGSDDTIDFAGWSPSHPFNVVVGVSLRQIADMTDPPQLFGISPMGASAHFFSSHYKDQTSAWLNGRFFRDPVQTADIRKNGFSPVLFKARGAGSLTMKLNPGTP
jgi:penicillin amidase